MNEKLIQYKDQEPIRISSITSLTLTNSSYNNEDCMRISFYFGTRNDRITWEFIESLYGKSYKEEAKKVFKYLEKRYIEKIDELSLDQISTSLIED